MFILFAIKFEISSIMFCEKVEDILQTKIDSELIEASNGHVENEIKKDSDSASLKSSFNPNNLYIFKALSGLCMCVESASLKPSQKSLNSIFKNFIWKNEAVATTNNQILVNKKTNILEEQRVVKKISKNWSANIRRKKTKKEMQEQLAGTDQLDDKFILFRPIENRKTSAPKTPSETEDEDINVDELVSKFLANMRQQQQVQESNSSAVFSGSTDECKVTLNSFDEDSSKWFDNLKSFKSMKSDNSRGKEPKNLTLNDYFQQKLLSDLIKSPDSAKGVKKKTFHSRLLSKELDTGLNHGKMVKYTDNHAYNSDDSSDVSDRFESSLFYRYGMANRFVDSSFKSELLGNKQTVKFIDQKQKKKIFKLKKSSKMSRAGPTIENDLNRYDLVLIMMIYCSYKFWFYFISRMKF